MSTLNNFWSYTIQSGEELLLEPGTDRICVVTDVSLADNSILEKNAFLSAHVEILPGDLLRTDPDAPSIDYDLVLCVFTPTGPNSHKIFVPFSRYDITYLRSDGASISISGYTIYTS